ncbi:MAG: hypothetical protein U9Q07_02170 [Planctomycetota bacterium]|nr:hypothetical protein [Planctomycetota bacterium]
MKTSHDSRPRTVPAMIILALVWPGLSLAANQEPSFTRPPSHKYFKIQVVDRQTGRGVPLVELRTVNSIRYLTDSNGIAAFHEPGLMDREVFFFVDSHGYEFPKDGFGYRGKRLKTTPGSSAVIKIVRLNIAERLYRITGQGIYRDSVLTGQTAPLENPVLNGQVMGQDSVYTCVYNSRLFWLWGDTNRPSYPLGHFATAGAFSDLPASGGLDPSVGVNLEYLVDDKGFSRPLCRLKEKGLVWLDGLLIVKNKQGRERMVAKYARMKDLGQAFERGLVVFNDATGSFEPLVRSDPDFLPYHNSGHALAVNVAGQKYYYFAVQFPLAVRMRVRAEWDHVIDPNRYEVLTVLPRRDEGILPLFPTAGKPVLSAAEGMPAGRKAGTASPLSSLVHRPSLPRWVRAGELIEDDAAQMPSLIKTLKQEKKDTHLYDIASGKKVIPHGGSVYFNVWRNKWVMITVQQFGDSSHLGEVWYAEADTPVGPWAYARKIVTHNKYTFYNPMQHPYFDRDSGRVIYFEGTYSHTFSGSDKNPTPRYDYNQIMYRLNLDDPLLALPVAVYQVRDKQGRRKYLLRDGAENAGKWDSVESVPFYAVEPGRASDDLVAIYTNDTELTTESPERSAKALFYAVSKIAPAGDNAAIVSLYEYRHSDSEQRLYSTDPARRQRGWIRTAQPLCRVWKAPPGPLLRDSEAKPYNVKLRD